MGYYFYYPHENKIVIERYVDFLEKDFILQKESGRIVELEDKDILPSENTTEHPIKKESLAPIVSQEEDVIPVCRSVRPHKAPNRLSLNVEIDPDRLCFNVEVKEHSLGDLNEPANYKAALSDPKFKKWLVAMNAEMQSMYDDKVWRLVVLPPNAKVVKKEEIYMEQPEDFIDPNHPMKVSKLQRSIYGLMQASRSWNKRFDEEIKKFGFHQNLDEPCVYQKASGSNVIFLILYVEDIILIGNHIPSLPEVKTYLGKCFSMKDLGEAAFILRIKIYRDRSRWLIGLTQNAYLDKILKRYRIDNSKRGSIPMIHYTTVKNILKYLRNTKDTFLVYGGDPEAELRVNCAVVWKSSKQSTTTQHATKAEYIAASEAVKKAVWIRKFIDELGVVPSNDYPIKMNYDNSATIIMANESGNHNV
ncbi:retrotransposon protein, putative, ty1-copia subclass [Tanacetum coccineum]